MVDYTIIPREFSEEERAFMAYFEDKYKVSVELYEPSDVDVDGEADVRSKTE